MDDIAYLDNRRDTFFIITMHTEGIWRQFQRITADGGYGTLAANLFDLFEHFFTCMYRARFGARQQFTIVIVAAVGKCFEPEIDAMVAGFLSMFFGFR
jgi:hypothetical protein